MKSLKSSVIGAIAFAGASALFSTVSSAEPGARGIWGSTVPAWPTSVNESAPSKSLEWPHAAAYARHDAVGATGEVRGGEQTGDAQKRASAFPTSVNESAPGGRDR